MVSYTPEDAKRRIPSVLRHIALTAIDCSMTLDTLPVNSRGVEARVMSLQGYVSHLLKLCMTVWREPKDAPRKAHRAR